MKRRDFSLATAGLTVAGTWSSAQAQAPVQGKAPMEGSDFIALDKPAPVEAAAGKVEVVEFFWYSCPHCNAFEPKLEAWMKKIPPHVAMRRVPVAFQDSFVPQQRLFYVLEALGKLPELHAKVFYAIHVEKQPLNREDSIGAWLEKQGVDKAKFTELYNSFSISTKVRRASQLQEAYKVQGVPALGIAGRFYTDGGLAGTMDRAVAVADFLIAQSKRAA
jgi:protein dithiol oxidoreductase (disulfide-forming)